MARACLGTLSALLVTTLCNFAAALCRNMPRIAELFAHEQTYSRQERKADGKGRKKGASGKGAAQKSARKKGAKRR
jgi:hypothetical protein